MPDGTRDELQTRAGQKPRDGHAPSICTQDAARDELPTRAGQGQDSSGTALVNLGRVRLETRCLPPRRSPHGAWQLVILRATSDIAPMPFHARCASGWRPLYGLAPRATLRARRVGRVLSKPFAGARRSVVGPP